MSTSFAPQSPAVPRAPGRSGSPGRGRPAGKSGGGRPTRVLIGTDTYPPDVNGAAYFTARLARGLAERGADVHVLCPSPSGRPHVAEQDGVVEHRLRSMPSLAHESVRLVLPTGVRGHLNRLLDRMRPNAVHIQNHFLVGRMLANAAHADAARAFLAAMAGAEGRAGAEYVRDPRLPPPRARPQLSLT